MAATTEAPSKRIHADPTKDFFVTMITRDISFQDCIFDLLDNSVDGARRVLAQLDPPSFEKFEISITFDGQHFQITDNCGGIPLSDAIDYAFHFGRRPDAPDDVRGGIGLYGIGMKRAIFKIGRLAEVFTETPKDSYVVRVDVDKWEKEKDWDFEYEEKPKAGLPSTSVRVSKLRSGAITLFEDPTFPNSLVRAIARDYSFFISKGLAIFVGKEQVPSYKYELREGAQLTPASEVYLDDGVEVRIVAGLVDDLPDDVPDELRPDKVDRFGWFVVCNDRVVLAGDKTERTVWGDDEFPVWHPQYNGFAGFVFFTSSDPKKLPWTTTKRELDASDPLYRRTLEKMKQMTETFIAYTNKRKGNLDTVKESERGSTRSNVYEVRSSRPMVLPAVAARQPDGQVTISYKKNREVVRTVADQMGSPWLSNKEVGSRTFDYYLRMELGK